MTEPEKVVRTAAATAARKRQREEAVATLLVSRGWSVKTPDGADWSSILLQSGTHPGRD